MDDATRTIEIERTINTQFENTELTGELHEIHRDLKGGVRDVRCDTVPLASMLDRCAEFKLQVEASLRTYDSLGIDGSELGRPALAGLPSLTTCVEETIAKGQLLDDVMAQMEAIERLASRPACALTTPWALTAQSWAVQLLQDCPASPPGLRRQSRRDNCWTM